MYREEGVSYPWPLFTRALLVWLARMSVGERERECGRYARLFTAEQHRRSRNLYRRSMTSDPGKTRQSAPSRRPLSRRRKEGEENFLRPRANVPRLFLPSSLLSSILSFFSTRTFYHHVCLFLLQDFSHKFYFPLYIYIYIFVLLFWHISLNSSRSLLPKFHAHHPSESFLSPSGG